MLLDLVARPPSRPLASLNKGLPAYDLCGSVRIIFAIVRNRRWTPFPTCCRCSNRELRRLGLRRRRALGGPVRRARGHQVLRAGFRRLLALCRRRSRGGAPGDRRLLPAGERAAVPSRQRPPVRRSTPSLSIRASGSAASSPITAAAISFWSGSHFLLSGPHAGILLGLLPPIVHIRQPSDQAALRWSLERMRERASRGQPGGFLIAEHLAHMILIQALRQHLTEALKGGVGWLFALADKQMAAIGAMHENPAHDWTLLALAERAGIQLDLRRQSSSGRSDGRRWTISRAGARRSPASGCEFESVVSAIALSLGYESKRRLQHGVQARAVPGRSPRQYGREQGPGPPSPGEVLTGGAAPKLLQGGGEARRCGGGLRRACYRTHTVACVPIGQFRKVAPEFR